ncbi:MAG: hypothetical protein CSA84_00170 [Actinomycetales bacterium]|nr:MAG: hypothetical protein CSA84_00170 [Actinomycetales bacterium]
MRSLTSRFLASLISASLVLVACTNPDNDTSGESSPAGPGGSLVFDGESGQSSEGWAEDVDPDSVFGLHRRKGIEPVLKPETLVLSAEQAQAVQQIRITNEDECLSDSDVHPMCRFELEFAELPDGLAVGSVVNSGTTESLPHGLLVKVTEIDGSTVSAVQATLQDALVQGEFWIEHTFTPQELRAEPQLAPGVEMVPRSAGAGAGVGGGPGAVGAGQAAPLAQSPAFDELSLPGKLKIHVEPIDGVTVDGTLDFGAGCGLTGGVGGSDVAWFEFSCRAWEKAGLAVRSTTTGVKESKSYPVALIPFTAFPVPIGPVVVVVVVDMLITVDLDGTVHATLEYGATQSTEVTTGLRYSITGGLDHTGSVDSNGLKLPTVLGGDVSAGAVGRAELRLSAYGVLGFGIGAEARVGIVGGPTQTPRWRLTANAGIYGRIFLGLLGYELTGRVSYHLPGGGYEIARHVNAAPVIHIVWPDPGTVIVKNGLLPRQVEATAIDSEDGPVPVMWTDQTDQVTVTGLGPQTLPFHALGEHKLVVEATDSEGKMRGVSMTVTVVAPTTTMTIALRTPDGAAVTDPKTAVGDLLLADAEITSTAIEPPSCSELTWTATHATVEKGSGCRARITPTTGGDGTVTATLTDDFGQQITATATFTAFVPLLPPGAGAPAPRFEAINATYGDRELVSGDTMPAAGTVQLRAIYLNPQAAKQAVTYDWQYVLDGQAPVELVSTPPDGGETPNGDIRSYVPVDHYHQHTVEFRLTIRSAADQSVITTRSITIHWMARPR